MISRPRSLSIHLLLGLLLAAGLLPAAPAAADEGMWLFNEFPEDLFRDRYGFAPSDAWLAQVRTASVRFNNGGSGSFVSPEGLVLTNHHVGFDCIQKVSSAEHDYVAEGFTAAGHRDELRCPDLELNVLVSIERVTDRVQAAVGEGLDTAAAGEARRGAIAALEAACQEKTGLRCDVVKLYAGGEYDLYRFRRHTDVRLVWAPELQLASFGGDPDNFEYPRFAVDAAIFRVWEDGRPHEPESFLPVDAGGPEQGEVAFLVGNPGSTGRLSTVAELEWLRDRLYPYLLQGFAHRRDVLEAFSARGEEQARIAKDDLLGAENALKAVSGYMSGLLDEELMAKKAAQEAKLRKAVAADAGLAARIGDPWGELEAAQAYYDTVYPRHQALEGLGHAGRLASTGWKLVRLARQRERPDAERLGSYREPALPSLFQQLYSEAPIYPEYEELRLTQALRELLYQFGPTHPLVVSVFGDDTPEQVAHRAVTGTKLGDVEARRELAEGGAAAVAAADDPMIVLLRKIEPRALELTEAVRDRVDAVEEDAGARIAEAWFAVEGRDTYPDATFTPRISFGRIVGYEQGGAALPWHTTWKGLFERAARLGPQPPYDLPKKVAAAKQRIDLSTPMDFLSTHDIIGGNSGSPVIDREGNFIGVVFDGNLEMLPNRFIYSDVKSRAISVDARAILEALTAVYGAEHVADELLGGAIAVRGADAGLAAPVEVPVAE
jgi:hypothetical protein